MPSSKAERKKNLISQKEERGNEQILVWVLFNRKRIQKIKHETKIVKRILGKLNNEKNRFSYWNENE